MALSWKTVLQSTAGIAVTIIVLLLCIAYFTVGLATRSHPSAYQESSATVGDTVRVYRNSFGIPHVVCATDTDLVYAQGWVHAQDRLWQMDMWRRSAQGRLAAVLGGEFASTDAFLRSLDLQRIVRDQYEALSPASRKFLRSYARGVSAYIEQNGERLAFEFDALGYHPDPWRPEDCLLVAKMLALHQSPAFWNDVVYTKIAQQRGREAMMMYVPTSLNDPCSLDSLPGTSNPYTPVGLSDTTRFHLPSTTDILSKLSNAQQRIGLPSTIHASNCWAVGRGDDGAILANDPHLAVGMPSKWYQIHLTTPNLNVLGLSIPGLPFVLSGRND